MRLVWFLGKITIALSERLGRFALFGAKLFRAVFSGAWCRADLFEQMEKIGTGSLFMVLITSVFAGMVMAVQTFDQFVRFGATGYIGGVIALTMTRELSPVLTGLVVTGRVGSAMAAEIGTMKVSEQLEALRAFGISEVGFVGGPRLLACTVMLPVLIIFSIAISILGGFVYVASQGVPMQLFERSVIELVTVKDLLGGLTKGLTFGMIMAVVSCSEGFNAKQGAKGVGRATTSAVIWSNMLILITNFFLSFIFFGGLQRGNM